MSYTDEQMLIATQIAYIDFDEEAVTSGKYTVMELLEMMAQSGGDKSEKARTLIEKINNSETAKICGTWKMKDIGNYQDSTGMYACMIETGEDEAMIAFRGSESDSLDQTFKDWGVADLGLLNSVLTKQQASAETYMKYIYETYGGQYESFGLTGHSLGGNLAEHAVITAPDKMKKKISRCISFDGPGYSAAYIAAHALDINGAKGLIEHYQWSWVGTLLTPLPGTDYRTIDANFPDGDIVYRALWRHDTVYVKFDGDGKVIDGKRDAFTECTSELSKALDYYLFWSLPGLIPGAIINTVDDLIHIIKKYWGEWSRERYSGIGSAEFSVDTGMLERGIEEMSALISKVDNCAERLDSVQRGMEIDSISAVMLRLKIWKISNTLESLSGKLDDYCESGMSCAEHYRQKEQMIVLHAC